MSNIKLYKASKHEVMRELSQFTSSGSTVDKALKLLQNNKELLCDNEFVSITQEFPPSQPGVMNMMVLQTKYSINVKKSVIALIIFLLDYHVTKGVASFAIGLSGNAAQTIHEISVIQRCILLDILVGNKKEAKDFDYNGNECVQNDICCSFRDDGLCRRDLTIINETISDLLDKDIIIERNGVLKLAF